MLLQSGSGDTGIKIIDLSEVPRTVLPIVVGVLARFVFDVQFWIEPSKRVPITLVCDEAHLYLPAGEGRIPNQEAALAAFESIAKEGRKYGLGLLIASQRPTDVSVTVLSQCNNFVVMRITDDRDQAMIERLLPESVPGIKGVLPVLDVGEGVVIGDATVLTSRVKFDPPRIKPSSATQRYWSMWSEQPSSRDAINAGVEALRNQQRGEF
jgi:DNA helicase HerA-like ATPase